jgi:hypothetical protein
MTFSLILQKICSPYELNKIIKINKSRKGADYKNMCASADFLDSNEVMYDAFKIVLGNGIDKPFGMISESQFEVWNCAWDLAKSNDFYINGVNFNDYDINQIKTLINLGIIKESSVIDYYKNEWWDQTP